MQICIYTSSRATSLQKVACDISDVVSKHYPDYDVKVIESPIIDLDIITECNACISVAAFDLSWGIPFFFLAHEHLSRGHPTIIYATIEGRARREMVREWIIRDLIYVANSEYTREKLVDVGARVIDVVYHGVDAKYIQSFEEKGMDVRSQLGEDKVIIGYIAQGVERKGHDLFAKVVAEVEARDKSVQFVILTDHKGGEHYKNTNAIVYNSFGQLSDELYYSLINALDIYTQASLSEGFGIPLLEAMAAKKIVVHPNYKPLSEITTESISIRVPIKEILLAKIGGSGIIYELKIYEPRVYAERLLQAVRMVREGGERVKILKEEIARRAEMFDKNKVYRRLIEHLLATTQSI